MMTNASTSGRLLLVGLAAVVLGGCANCEGPQRKVESLPDVGYPTCDDAALPEGTVVASGVLRAGPVMRDQEVVERFEVRERGCVTVVRVQQEWALGTTDVDAVFDENLLPLRVWKRTMMPDGQGGLGHLDVRVVEMRTEPVGLTRRRPTGEREHFEVRGARPQAVIGPGRGLLTMWFQRAKLAEGEKVREPILDVREPIAVIEEVTLQRLQDQEVDGLGRVRVYTIYGREPVFADENDVVLGDMFGMRPASTIAGPLPDPMPDPGPIEPTSLP